MWLTAVTPRTALAHEKWFTDKAFHATEWELVWSDRTLFAVGSGLIAIALFTLLQRLIGDPNWPRLPFLRRMAGGDVKLLAVQTAITLIYMSARLALLVPQLTLQQDWVGFGLAAIQVLIAFSFITGLLDRAGAVLLFMLALPIIVLFGPLDMLQLAYYAGIAFAVLLIGASREVANPRPPFDSPYLSRRGLWALRILAGVAFTFIALGDKIWNPDLGRAFLQQYPHFNVARSIFQVNLPDDTFVLIAGCIETAAGMLLLSGKLTRLVILILLVPFNLTVPFLPAEEMIGHLPIFGILYVLLVHGAEGLNGRGQLPA
jgi:hypothetical protein